MKYDHMPELYFISYTSSNFDAMDRRRFSLIRPWVCNVNVRGFNGLICIPANGDLYDGGSIPLYPLISFLTFGILRPLGIILLPSLIHDFIYNHGYMIFNGDDVPITRKEADLILRDLFMQVNPSYKWLGHLIYATARIGGAAGYNKYAYEAKRKEWDKHE